MAPDKIESKQPNEECEHNLDVPYHRLVPPNDLDGGVHKVSLTKL